ncbi:MAG: helix-turn-helix domain-containing protein [Agathobacter sp.]|uniref:helix-turn-helix domain-containing protein n=1 Tax=Agathobacter sp. TaxID=2021311 RepID=UPI003992BBF5
MAVRNAGKIIREARLKAGLTQEQMSEDICSVLTLSRIENNSAGVSPSLFQALMSRAGAPRNIFPVFPNRKDFDCFYTLKRARLYLESWQLQEAYDELLKVKNADFSNNKFHYQEWLYLQGCLQSRSGSCEHQLIYEIFISALIITKPNIDFSDLSNELFSDIELELLIEISNELLYLSQSDLSYIICSQLESYINNAELSFIERDRLLSRNAIARTKYLLYTHDYNKALETINEYRHLMVVNSENTSLLELNFWTAMSYYYCGNIEKAHQMFNDTFYSARAIESCYATTCLKFVSENTSIVIDDYIKSLPPINCKTFKYEKITDSLSLSDGTYDLFSPDVLTLGRLIYVLRKEQNISQAVLCQGLCSKSKLSKIENDQLQPDIFLSEALLQRLGVSERVFSFWGNSNYKILYELKSKILNSKLTSLKEQFALLKQFKELLSENNNILLQFYYALSYDFLDESERRIATLQNALNLTLPDFDILNINNYRLSLIELGIIGNIAYEYREISPSKSNLYFSKLLEYRNLSSVNIMFQSLVYPIFIYKYAHSLYHQKYYLQLSNLYTFSVARILKIHLDSLGFFTLFFVQALGECNDYKKAFYYGKCAASIERMLELHSNALSIASTLKSDFDIEI